jgi:hypothetical protein
MNDFSISPAVLLFIYCALVLLASLAGISVAVVIGQFEISGNAEDKRGRCRHCSPCQSNFTCRAKMIYCSH